MTDVIDPTEDELTDILKPWDWESFEDTVSGHRRLGNTRVRTEIFDFYLRVGLFLKKPMRAVLSCGKFVWMKEEKQYHDFAMVPLDPACPDTNRFPTGLKDCPWGWRPSYGGWVFVANTAFPSAVTTSGPLTNFQPSQIQAQIQQAQQAQMAQLSITGITGNTSSPPLSGIGQTLTNIFGRCW